MSALHNEAVAITKKVRKLENKLVETLIGIQEEKFFKSLGHPSLFAYCVKELDLTESRTYELITVSRKALDNNILRQALQNEELSISKAARIVSALDKTNARELVTFASTHTVRETEAKLRKENLGPKRKTLKFEEETAALMQKTAEVAGLTLDNAMKKLCTEYLKRRDKLAKAERVKPQTPAEQTPGRKPIPAAIQHALYRKFEGQCGIRDHKGERCMNKTFLQMHHIKEVQHGGTNDLSNLILVCSAHHEMIHQMEFPLKGQTSWQKVAEQSGISQTTSLDH